MDICEGIAQVIPKKLIQHQMRTPCYLKDWSLFLHLKDSKSLPSQHSQPAETSDADVGFIVVTWNKAQKREFHNKINSSVEPKRSSYAQAVTAPVKKLPQPIPIDSSPESPYTLVVRTCETVVPSVPNEPEISCEVDEGTRLFVSCSCSSWPLPMSWGRF